MGARDRIAVVVLSVTVLITAPAATQPVPAIPGNCEGIAAPAPPEAPAPERAYALHELGASGLLLDRAAKAAWEEVLGPLRAEPWLAELDGPSPQNRIVAIDGRPFLLASACMNHDCYENSVVVLYDAAAGAMYGEVYSAGEVTLLGAPPPSLQPELHRLWREEFRQGEP